MKTIGERPVSEEVGFYLFPRAECQASLAIAKVPRLREHKVSKLTWRMRRGFDII